MERIIMLAPQFVDEINIKTDNDGSHCVHVKLRFNHNDLYDFPVYFARACEDDERSAGDPPRVNA